MNVFFLPLPGAHTEVRIQDRTPESVSRIQMLVKDQWQAVNGGMVLSQNVARGKFPGVPSTWQKVWNSKKQQSCTVARIIEKMRRMAQKNLQEKCN